MREALRAERLAMAEDFTRQALELQGGMPEISLVLAAKALSITQQDGLPPIPAAMQQVRDLLRRPTAWNSEATTDRSPNWPPAATAVGSPAATTEA